MTPHSMLLLAAAFLAGVAAGILLDRLTGFMRSGVKTGGVMDMHLAFNVLNRMSTAPNITARESESIVFLARYLLTTSSQHATRDSISAEDVEQVLVAFSNMMSWYARGAYAEMRVDCDGDRLRCDVGELLRGVQKLMREVIEDGKDVVGVRIENDPAKRGWLICAVNAGGPDAPDRAVGPAQGAMQADGRRLSLRGMVR